MVKNLTILVAPLPAVGHINSCIGLAETLRDRGHKIVFIVEESMKGKLVRYGFVEAVLKNVENEKSEKLSQEFTSVQHSSHSMVTSGLLSGISSLEKMKILSELDLNTELITKAIEIEPQIKAIIAEHNPDLYIVDNIVGSPSLVYSSKPWVYLSSANPLFVIIDERTPPAYSGLPANGDKSEWKRFRDLAPNILGKPSLIYNEWLTQNGFPAIPGHKCIPVSSYLNIYGFPEELDYTDLRPIPEKWFRVDSFMRRGEQEFELPEQLTKWMKTNDKLIYFSLGSMGSIDVELMKRLVNILSKSDHKFIVSKGLLGDSYELASNMWGQKSVPQTRVLPLVDLVVTHGGNNTVTETMSFGKPMVIMPLFADQFDNAQRVEEKGFGVRLDPYGCSETDLLNAIEKILNDNDLKERLSVASERMLNSKSHTKAAKLIESLVK